MNDARAISSTEALFRLATAAQLQVNWTDAFGQAHTVAETTLRALLEALGLPCATPEQVEESLRHVEYEQQHAQLPKLVTAVVDQAVILPKGSAVDGAGFRIDLESGESIDGVVALDAAGVPMLPAVAVSGYHRLTIAGAEVSLAVAPTRAFAIDDLRPGKRLWGLGVQTYSVPRPGDGGIGDFGALAQLARHAAAAGADVLAMSPAHALFAADLKRFGPYAPSSRVCLNAMYADPAAIFGAKAVARAVRQAGVAEVMAAGEGQALIDWPEAAAAKYKLMRALYADFRKSSASAQLTQDFRMFCEAGGELLEDHARFEALQAARLAIDRDQWHWSHWPQALRNPRSAEVAKFARENADEVDFHRFAQWIAERSLRAAQTAARDAGMAVGLIADLAVGTDGGGSQAWSRQGEILAGVSVGAPPDALNALGQNWGLTAFSPLGLVRAGFAPFLEMLRASLRNTGGVRIDHVLGFARLWLIPDGANALEGAYLHFPLGDFLRLIALESWRHRAIVIGEDLGTVPEGFRATLSASGLYGMRVLWFERDWGFFVEPARWSADAVAMTSTHDVATVAGWWTGSDIQWRAKVGQLASAADLPREQADRAKDRGFLWGAFQNAGLVSGDAPAEHEPEKVVDAALRYTGSTPSRLAMIPIEDALGLIEQPNIPGTIDEHPNWRRRLPGSADTLLESPAVAARLKALATQRKS